MYILIFDTVEPYIYESLPIMFLPSGFHYEARFKSHHIPKKIRDSLKDGKNSDFIRHDLLIFVRKVPETNKDQIFSSPTPDVLSDWSLIPIRHAKILSVGLVGRFVLIRYCLGQFFNSDALSPIKTDRTVCRELEQDIYKAQENQFKNGQLPHFFNFDGIPPDKENALLTRIDGVRLYGDNPDLSDERANFDAWTTIIQKFFLLSYINNLPFLMFCGVRSLKNKGKSDKGHLSSSQFLSLQPSTTYEIKILETLPHELNELSREQKVKLDTKIQSRPYQMQFDDNFASKQSSQQAIGGYDFLEFVVPLKYDTHGATGTIKFYLDEKQLRGRDFISPHLDVEYRVGPGNHKHVAVVGMMALFASVVFSGFQTELLGAFFGSGAAYQPKLNIVYELLNATIFAIGMAGVLPFLVRWLR